MTRRAALLALAERVERDGPGYVLECDIAEGIGRERTQARAYTVNAEDAMALCDRTWSVFPERIWISETHGAWTSAIINAGGKLVGESKPGPRPMAASIAAAALRARAAMEE